MALKRIKSEADHRPLGHVRFWTEDLAAIVSLIEQATQGDVEIRIDDELSAANVTDLADYPHVRMTSFVVTAPGIVLILGAGVASLRLDEPNLTALGMANEIERIAKVRRRHAGDWLAEFRKALSLTPFSPLVRESLQVSGGNESVVLYARSQKDAPTWLARNKDGLTTNVIVSAVFGVLGFLAGYFIHR
ncbi:hypothetical protein AB0368_06455 [Actinoplanes sp. NPDC051475]|uniref:hypothetical protein n=1 Tax=Actinoplanes sp. NPDC051475 TaxID=3157225 RepID=UPI00344F51B8